VVQSRERYIDRFFKLYKYINTLCKDFYVYIFVSQEVYNEIITHKQYSTFIYHFEFIIRDIKTLPGRECCDYDCPPYKLDPRLPHNKKIDNVNNLLNKLNLIYLNKFYFINEIYKCRDIASCIWLDFGFSDKLNRLPGEVITSGKEFQPGIIYTRRYGNGEIVNDPVKTDGLMKMRPYRLLHSECNIPHFIKSGVMGMCREGFSDIYNIYNTELKSISREYKCFDEETVLSNMFIKYPGVFSRWSSLLRI